MRWLLTGAMAAALLLPPGAALVGAAVGRWLGEPGLREQVRVTPRGVARLALRAGLGTAAPALLAVLVSALGWMVISLGGGARSGLPGPAAIGMAHAVVAAAAVAFAAWGLALSVRRRGGFVAVYCLLPTAYCLLVACPALLSPLLPRLQRPERALQVSLLVNPVTAAGAALGMDVLRSPRVYSLTRAPEYWYSYPPAAGVAAVFLAAAAVGARQFRRELERE
jgi:hypothetical protein